MSEINIWDDEDEAPKAENSSVMQEAKTAARFELTALETDLAYEMDIDLSVGIDHLISSAALKQNSALTLVLESGLLLLAAQQKIDSERSESGLIGEIEPILTFKKYLENVGLPEQRAYEAMSMAKYAAGLPLERRAEMLSMPKTKVMLLAQADPEVIADLFADEGIDVGALSIRDMKIQIRELKAAKTQAGVERNRAEEKAERLERELKSAQSSREDMTDIVPAHVSDIRLECAALYKKAELSIDGIARLHGEVNLFDGECAEWALSCARSNFAALQSLIAQAKGAAAELHRQYGADLDGDNSTMERLTQKELFKCAVEYRQITAEHEHEAAMRAHIRDADKPKGKGRPKAAPVKEL